MSHPARLAFAIRRRAESFRLSDVKFNLAAASKKAASCASTSFESLSGGAVLSLASVVAASFAAVNDAGVGWFLSVKVAAECYGAVWRAVN